MREAKRILKFKECAALLTVGLVGYGYWGPNLARNFSQHEGFQLAFIADQDSNARLRAERTYPSTPIFATLEEGLKAANCDLVAVSSPPNSHFSLARVALNSGCAVLVEKPITLNSKEAEELIAIADSKGMQIFVDHTFLFTPAVRYIRNLIADGELGDLIYVTSQRVNLGLVQTSTSVLWDLAVHDLAIIDYWVGGSPESIHASGSVVHPHTELSTGFLSLRYPNDFVASVTVGWMSPIKVRHIAIVGSRRTVIFDDNEPIEKVRVLDTSVFQWLAEDEDRRLRVEYRTGDIVSPKLPAYEGLACEVDEIFQALTTGAAFSSDAGLGLRVVKSLEVAEKSLKSGSFESLNEI